MKDYFIFIFIILFTGIAYAQITKPVTGLQGTTVTTAVNGTFNQVQTVPISCSFVNQQLANLQQQQAQLTSQIQTVNAEITAAGC